MITANLFISNHLVLPHHCQITRGSNWSLSNLKPQEALTLAHLHCQPARLFHRIIHKFTGHFWVRLGLAANRRLLRALLLVTPRTSRWPPQVRAPYATKMNVHTAVALSQMAKSSSKEEADCMQARKQLFHELSYTFAKTAFTVNKDHWSGILHGTIYHCLEGVWISTVFFLTVLLQACSFSSLASSFNKL